MIEKDPNRWKIQRDGDYVPGLDRLTVWADGYLCGVVALPGELADEFKMIFTVGEMEMHTIT